MVSIIIADDHQMFIDGIKLLLKHEADIYVVGEALNGKELLDLLEKQTADIILMDINMPLLNGIEATKIIKKKYPKTKVLMLTMHSSKHYVTKMIASEVSGYILKNTGKEELIKAIETLRRGETYYSQEVTRNVMESFRKNYVPPNTIPELTDREKEVIRLLSEDYSTQEIADKLSLSHFTIEAHRRNILSKFNVRSMVGLIKIVLENGLLD